MYAHIKHPFIDVYDQETKQFIGTVTFELPPESEEKVLNYVNYNRFPPSLIVTNLNMSPGSSGYSFLNLPMIRKRIGVFRGIFQDPEIGESTPIYIYLVYNVTARHIDPSNPRHLNSAQYDILEARRLSV